MSHRITVNGEPHLVEAAPDTPLLYVLRNDLGLNGPKFGCGLGQCGACAAIVGGSSQGHARSPCTTSAKTKLFRRDLRQRRAGEGSLPPTSAALANAFAHATGRRLRELPMTPERVKAALS